MDLIFRAKHDKEHLYVMLAKETLYDRKLSLKAKGMLAFIMSKPDDWCTYVTALSEELKESRNTIASTLNELIKAGYCLRSLSTRLNHGHFSGYDYLFFETLEERKAWEGRNA